MHGNWLLTANPFKLAPPPQWWLTQLNDYDSQLVVFPSQIRMAYILARRRTRSNAMAELNRLDLDTVRQTAGLDGAVMADHNLIYVRHLIGNTIRQQGIFQWLRDCDTLAQGGGEKIATRLEETEADRAARKRATMISDIDHRARDAWRSYQARTGRRAGVQPKGASAKPMPTGSFTPKESSVAMFVRD